MKPIATVPLIIMSLIVGALVSAMGMGGRSFHFLPSFILVSGFVLGVGLLVNRVLDRLQRFKS